MKKYNITVNGNLYEVVVEEVDVASPVRTYTSPTISSSAPKAQKTSTAPKASAVAGKSVISPMPGTILDVKVSIGQSVKKGDVICVLEAMKMENDIPAPCDGVIASINVQKGSSIDANDVIASIN